MVCSALAYAWCARVVCTGQYHRNPLHVHSGSRRRRDVRGRPSRLWDATSACDMKIDLTQAVCKRVEVEVERVHDGGFGEILWRRVLLSDAAIEDDDFLVASDLSPVAQYGEGGEGSGGLGADVSCSHASRERLHLGDGVFAYRDGRAS